MSDERWDENNKPTEFIIGVSPGFSQYMTEQDAKLNFQGFWRKIMKATRFGFEFVMIDYEALSEMYEPDIDKKVEQVKKTEGVEIGLHLPFAMDLTEAYTHEWDSKHQILIRGIYAAAKLLKAKFALVHSANTVHTALTFKMGSTERPGNLCAFEGTSLGEFLEKVSKGEFKDPWREYFGKSNKLGKIDMKGWFIAKFLKTLFTGIAVYPEPIVALYEFENFDEAIESYFSLLVYTWKDVKPYVEKLANQMREYDEISEKLRNMSALKQRKADIERMLEEARKRGDDNEVKNLEDQLNFINKELAKEDGLKERKEKLKGFDKFDTASIAQPLSNIANEIDEVANKKPNVENFTRISTLFFGDRYGRLGLYAILKDIAIKGVIGDGISGKETLEAFENAFREGVVKKMLAYSYNDRWKIYFKLISGLADHLKSYDINAWFDSWSYHGSEGVESQAYRTVAKFMYLTRDPLWLEVVEKDYPVEIDPDIVIDIEDGASEIAHAIARRNGKEKMYNFLMKMKSVERRRLMEKIFAAVAGKYIQGHLFAKNGKTMGSIGYVATPDGEEAFSKEEEEMSVYEYMKKHKIQFYLENGFNRQEGEAGMGKVRIMHMTDHCRIVHCIDRGEFVNYCPDFEHLIINFIDPSEDIKEIDDGYGKYITQIHINAPRPINATHGPINPMSTDMEEIYRWLYGLWKKGMKAAYLIWEMGSFGVRQSAIAFRKFKEALEKDPPPPPDPESLGREFFGIDENFEAATKLAVIEHAFDPLEGLFMVPEEKHGFLGNAVKEKGRIQDWEAEELL